MQVGSDAGVRTGTDVASSKALMDPLLLNLIFSYMDAPTLKNSVRPVCTLWADLAAPFVAKLTAVTFSEHVTCGGARAGHESTPETTLGLTKFHPKLVQHVKLGATTCPCEIFEQLPQLFVAAVPQIAGHLEQLEVTVDSSFLIGLHNMWESNSFKNLTTISITAKICNDENEGVDLPAEYPVMEKVKVISIIVTQQKEAEQDSVVSSMTQNLLNSAPNLEEVEVESSFYPDFGPCKKLTKLTYTFVQFLNLSEDFDWKGLPEDPVVLEMDEMTEMLNTCRETLTDLSLNQIGLEDEEGDDVEVKIFSLPSFPNLTRLSSSFRGDYRVGDCLHTTQLQNLTHVSFDNQFLSISKIFEHLRRPHVGITSLDVTAAYDGDEDDVATATKLVRLFPAVTTFQLNLTIPDDMNSRAIHRLKEALGNFGPWGLTAGIVEMINLQKSEIVSATMQGLVQWRGLAETEVRLRGASGSVFFAGKAAKEILLACRDVKGVKMEGFSIKKRDKFQEFIEENGLQINLSGCVE